jgi:hypothetical protein
MNAKKKSTWMFLVWLALAVAFFMLVAWGPIMKAWELIHTFLTTPDL